MSIDSRIRNVFYEIETMRLHAELERTKNFKKHIQEESIVYYNICKRIMDEKLES